MVSPCGPTGPPSRSRSLYRRATSPRQTRDARTPQTGTLLFTSGETRRRWKPRTMAQYRSIHRRLVASFGAMPLASIRPRHVAAYIDATSKQLGPASVGRDVDLLHAIFKTARREELVDANPADGAERPRLPPFRPQILEPVEVARVAKALGGVERVVFLTLVLTGLRRSELQRLRWRDVDLVDNLLRVRTRRARTGSARLPSRPRWPRSWQHRRSTAFQGDDELVFCHPERGTTYRAETFKGALMDALATAGVNKRPRAFHDLRHTAITNDAAAGLEPDRRHDEGRPLGHEDDQAVHASRRRRLPRRGGCTGAAAPRSCYSNCYSRRRSSRGTSPRGRRGWTQFDCVDALGRTSSSSRPFPPARPRDTCASDQGGGGLTTAAVTAEERRDELVGRLFGARVGAMDLFGVYLGDRLGLYRALADAGRSTSGELASAAGVHERYAREWLEQQAASGDPRAWTTRATDAERRYALPPATTRPARRGQPQLRGAVRRAARRLQRGRSTPCWRRSGTAAGSRTPTTGPTSTRARRASPGRCSATCSAREWLPAVPDVHERLPPILRRVSPTLPAAAAGRASPSPALTRRSRVDGIDLDQASIARLGNTSTAAGWRTG